MRTSLLTCLLCGCLLPGCTGFGPPTGEKWRELIHGDSSASAVQGLRSPDAEARRWSVIALARQGDPAGADKLIPMLDKSREPSALVRATAAAGLRMLGDKRAVSALLAACGDSEPIVRGEAARALGALGGPKEVPALARALREDREANVRLEAAYALTRIGGENALPALVAALDDLDASVAFAAHRALLEMTHQNLPPIRAPWQTWLEQRPPSN